MHQADQQKSEQPSHVERHEARAARRGTCHLNCHAPAEEEREKRVELRLHKELEQPHNEVVYCPHLGEWRVIAGIGSHVHEDNPKNRNTTQDINHLNAFFGPHWGHRGGCFGGRHGGGFGHCLTLWTWLTDKSL